MVKSGNSMPESQILIHILDAKFVDARDGWKQCRNQVHEMSFELLVSGQRYWFTTIDPNLSPPADWKLMG